MINFTKSAT